MPNSQFIRFLIAGAINTALSYAAYLAFLLLLPYALAYALAYALGILVQYLLAVHFVFRRRVSARSALGYPLIHLLQYVLGTALLAALIEWFGMPAVWAPLVVIAISVPLTFVLSRWLIAVPAANDAADTTGVTGSK